MSGWTLDRLLAGLECRPEPPRGLLVSGLALDSRAVAPGHLFLALAGLRRHGLEHADEAEARGACAIAFEPPMPAERPQRRIPLIEIPGLQSRVGPLAARFHGEPSRALRLVGVTGTNGKTSVSWLLAQCLAAEGRVAGLIGTLGAGLFGALEPSTHTTPDAVALQHRLAALRDAGAELVAMEVSSHALQQHRVDGCHFAIAVFTNLTRDHLDYHGTMEAYGAAKARLFRWPGLGWAVLNRDDPFADALARSLPVGTRLLDYAVERPARLRAEAVRSEPSGLSLRCVHEGLAFEVQAPLVGRFNVSNLLAVIACLRVLGWDGERIASICARLAPVPGRMNRVPGPAGAPLVVVDYAHTPDALAQALAALRPHVQGRLHCLFGCGGERDAGKRPQMAAVAERLADRVIVSDDNPRNEPGEAIIADILAGFADPARVVVERDRGRAIALAISGAAPGDAVLLAGKGHEAWQEHAGQKRPFDDRAEAQRALAAWGAPC